MHGGNKCFPFRVDPFPKRSGVQESKWEVIKVYPLFKDGKKSTQVFSLFYQI